MVKVRFERGRDDVVGPTIGPFEFVQVTYGSVRTEVGGAEVEIAYMDENADWALHTGSEVYSDFIIFDAKEEG